MSRGDRGIELVTDDDGRGGVTVVMDGSPQSHVSLGDPAHLAFEYVQHLATVIDTLPAGPLAVTHIGGAGMTLARYVNSVRPGSTQIVLEPDAALTELVRRELPLPRRHRIRVRPLDGLVGVAGLADASADVVVLDAYAEGRVPAELTTVEFLTDVARVLRPGGMALLNLADEPGLRYVARVLAGLRVACGEVAVIATHEVLKGKRFGNVVAVACRTRSEGCGSQGCGPGFAGSDGCRSDGCGPGFAGLDVAGLRREAARAPLPTGVRDSGQLARLLGTVRPWTSAESTRSPEPPPVKGWRRR